MTETIFITINETNFSRIHFRFLEKKDPTPISFKDIDLKIFNLFDSTTCTLILFGNEITIDQDAYSLISSAFRSKQLIEVKAIVVDSDGSTPSYMGVFIVLTDKPNDEDF